MSILTKAVRTERLREIAHAIADGNRSELSMRVPAEPDRDADLVIMAAADQIDQLRSDLAAARALLREADPLLLPSGDDLSLRIHAAIAGEKK